MGLKMGMEMKKYEIDFGHFQNVYNHLPPPAPWKGVNLYQIHINLVLWSVNKWIWNKMPLPHQFICREGILMNKLTNWKWMEFNGNKYNFLARCDHKMNPYCVSAINRIRFNCLISFFSIPFIFINIWNVNYAMVYHPTHAKII